ncbi:MAG: hypothetical protein U0Q18_35110 [Bryobacteraceae bacterium]
MTTVQMVPVRWRGAGPAGLKIFCCFLVPAFAVAQSAPDMRQILERLQRLEDQNRALSEEIHQLRQELAATRVQTQAASPGLEERVDVQQTRTEELAQTKVGSSQHFPLRLTGMALFNGFLNSKGSGGEQYPTFAWPGAKASGGGSLRQTTIGLEYSGPEIFWGGKVHGSVFMDFWGGSGASLDQDFRLRTGSIQVDWKDRSVMAGVETPIIAQRQPASLAQVAFSPLTGAGNLWLWIPQVRFEQRLRFNDQSGIRAQIGVVQTSEVQSYQSTAYSGAPARPGLEGRFELYHGSADGRRIEVAPGFHTSTTHVLEYSIPSNLFSIDWLARPWRKLELTGTFFKGKDLSPLGGLQQGYTVYNWRYAIPVHGQGGWAQLTYTATPRLSFHFFSGLEDDRDRDLRYGGIGRNWEYGANLYLRLAPNVLLGLETSQIRTTFIQNGALLNNHYDLALAYLF